MSELTIKDFKSKYEPIGLSMELKSQGQSAYETGKIGGHTPLYTDEQIQDYLSNQPQLTIPKSIAESKWMKHFLSCDLSQFEFERFDEFLNKEDEQFLKWVNTDKNENILYIYLAGKALGVDLVKVVEG
ncbi:hypothetical protein [Lactococcus lactis]|uniref:hypothetical protein n=1 Tax=Lactococcus lactis TaxID=1358 RepID=UPI003D27EDD3